MKLSRLLIATVLALVVALVPMLSTKAQTAKENIFVVGPQYTTKVAVGEKALLLGIGYGWHVAGPIWQISTGQLGTQGYVSAEPVLAYVFNLSGNEQGTQLKGALLGGISNDWLKLTDTSHWVSYVPGTIGGSLYLSFANGTGFVLSGRGKFALADNLYQDGFIFNLNVIKLF